MRKSTTRYQLVLSKRLSARLEALAAKPGVTKSAILSDAFEAWLAHGAVSDLEDRFSLRLDRMTRALGRVERNSHVLLETLALFVRYELAIHAPLAPDDAAGRAVARDRFNAFVTQVGRQIAAGNYSIAPDAAQESGE
ncbi:CopG family transcriptional regulator [Sphingomonas sp. LaA6.9]|uniref:CopG family transcriptional regulator n=1 Tax=Sphingomonas sp. LaA6.9 TaxID=2919914 RepID=UPI001F4FB85C|nr:CopG family transcriptional regulator [Sphingomonas sp. LaA6.9]MCJ8159158.1 CopG family transcriptional regulator [Sphingomonas sp. LaA6.9]